MIGHEQAVGFSHFTVRLILDQTLPVLKPRADTRAATPSPVGGTEQAVSPHRLMEMGFDGPLVNQIDGRSMAIWPELRLEPYEAMWLEKEA